jgi:formylglycine-generating enzyme required for sulfatase activity
MKLKPPLTFQKFLFGDDIFISYSRADGASYAAALANQLAGKRLSCRFDQWGTTPGKEVPVPIIEALHRSAMLVIVATEGAGQSEHVEREILEYLPTRRFIIAIDIDGAIKSARWWPLLEGLPISVDPGAHDEPPVAPSAEVVARIENSISFTKKDTRLRRTAVATGVFMGVFLTAAVLAAGAAAVQRRLANEAESRRAQSEARTAQAVAEGRRAALQSDLRRVLANGQTDFAGLFRLTRDYDSDWGGSPDLLNAEFIDYVNGDVFASAPWTNSAGFDPERLFSVISHGRRLFVQSRGLFGAMSYALEEAWLRSPDDPRVRERALALLDDIRSEFISFQKRTKTFVVSPPSKAQEDTLNAWKDLEPGEFTMGVRGMTDDELPVHRVSVSAFSIQQHEVTNEEYRRFDREHQFPTGQENHPVANVSWYEAAGYAAWLGASLPSEAQWEYAAAGTGRPAASRRSRRYPWGDEPPTPSRAIWNPNASINDMLGKLGLEIPLPFSKPVARRPRTSLPVSPPRAAGRTPDGVEDMAGNVSEWCRDWFGPYVATAGVDPLGPAALAAPDGVRVVRGGSFDEDVYGLIAALRDTRDPSVRTADVGLRLVSSRVRR